ncbi:hypothetical protein FQZ97_652120 [compost metagenome]
MQPPQFIEQRRHGIQHGRGNGTNMQHPGLPGCDFTHHALKLLDLGGELAHGGQNRRAGGGKLRTAPGAVEQLQLQRLFEHLYLLGQRRLRHSQTRCRPPEMPFLGHGKEHPELPYQPEVDSAHVFSFQHVR